MQSSTLFYVGDNNSLFHLGQHKNDYGTSRIFKGNNNLSSVIDTKIIILNHEDKDRSLASFLFIKYLIEDFNSSQYLNCRSLPLIPFKKTTFKVPEYSESYNSSYEGKGFSNFYDFVEVITTLFIVIIQEKLELAAH